MLRPTPRTVLKNTAGGGRQPGGSYRIFVFSSTARSSRAAPNAVWAAYRYDPNWLKVKMPPITAIDVNRPMALLELSHPIPLERRLALTRVEISTGSNVSTDPTAKPSPAAPR